jgi:NADPH:quinone reductase-like Zn-dependent oxidoreductase
MRAAQVLRHGPPGVITIDDVPRPQAGARQLLVRVKAAGVGNWDALIRERKVPLQPLPLILGTELSRVVEGLGAGVVGFKLGDEVYGATNEQFSGAYAEYAVPLAGMVAQLPRAPTFIEVNQITELFNGGKLAMNVGTLLSLQEARVAHEALAERRHHRGNIVLSVDSSAVG